MNLRLLVIHYDGSLTELANLTSIDWGIFNFTFVGAQKLTFVLMDDLAEINAAWLCKDLEIPALSGRHETVTRDVPES